VNTVSKIQLAIMVLVRLKLWVQHKIIDFLGLKLISTFTVIPAKRYKISQAHIESHDQVFYRGSGWDA
jgi:hypothetical protein